MELNETVDIDFNERFYWIGSQDMEDSYKESLRRGLPFPILTVAEYLSLCQEGFNWGAHYRAAGYYAGVTLWASFALWLMMNLLLVIVPRYGAYAMSATGTLMIFSTFIYWRMVPPHELIIQLEAATLKFEFGSCFYITFYSGIICIAVGFIIVVVDCIFPHTFSTVLEVDYDTPYDRHIIIEDSYDTRTKKKKLEEISVSQTTKPAPSLLRRVSSKAGLHNEGYEMDPPKSPWRYPFRTTAFPVLNANPSPSVHHRDFINQPIEVNRKDVATETVPIRSHIQLSRPPIRVPKYPFNRQISTDSQDSVATDHSGSSFGLSFLNRIRESTRIPPSPLAGPNETNRKVAHDYPKQKDMW